MACFLDKALINCNEPSRPIRGQYAKMWVYNRRQVTFTYDSNTLISNISIEGANTGYAFEGYKLSNDGGFSRKSTIFNEWQQFIKFEAWGVSTDLSEALNQMNDLIVIVKLYNQGADGLGQFRVYGADSGLYLSEVEQANNTNYGITTLYLRTAETENECYPYKVFFNTDAIITEAILDQSLLPPPTNCFTADSTTITADSTVYTADINCT